MGTAGGSSGSRWISGITGAGAGLLATSCCGTGALSLTLVGLGAGSSVSAFFAGHNSQTMSVVFFAFAVAIVLGASFFAIYRRRERLSALAFRALYMQTLTRTASWSIGAYLFWWIIVQPVTWKFHILIPRPPKA